MGVDVQPVWSPGNSHEQLGRPPALWRALGSVGLPRPVFPQEKPWLWAAGQ